MFRPTNRSKPEAGVLACGLKVCTVGLMELLQFAQNAIEASFNIFRYIGKSRKQLTVTGKFLGHNRPTDHAFEECYVS